MRIEYLMQAMRPGKLGSVGRVEMRFISLTLLGAAILLVPALWNGVPFLYFDSANYLSRPEAAVQWFLARLDLAGAVANELPVQGTALSTTLPAEMREPVISGRSIYYGMLAYLSYLAANLWPLLVVHALSASSVLALLWLRIVGSTSVAGFAALVVGLALATPLAFFAGLVMPDVLAGLLILAAAMLLVAWPRLLGADRWLLAGIVALAMVSHTSHLLLGAGLLMLAGAARLAQRWFDLPLSMKGVGVLAGAVGLTLALNTAFSLAVVRATGEDLIARPHITAHLLDDGPGIGYLERNCPDAGFVICDYRDRLPLEWRVFLFGRHPDAGLFNARDVGPETRRALSAEQPRFALAVLAEDPLGVIAFALRASIRQLGRFGVNEIAMNPERFTNVSEYFPETLVSATRASPLYADHRPMEMLTVMTYAAALAALAGLVLAASGGGNWRLRLGSDVQVAVVVVILLGIVLNAVICGVLASPYDRFQARVIWLLPLASVLALHLARVPASFFPSHPKA